MYIINVFFNIFLKRNISTWAALISLNLERATESTEVVHAKYDSTMSLDVEQSLR